MKLYSARELKRMRVKGIILYVVSVVCVFVPSHFIIQILATFFSAVGLVVGISADCELDALRRKEKFATQVALRRIKGVDDVPLPHQVVMEEEPPEIEIVYG